jgi:hypothetical protein
MAFGSASYASDGDLAATARAQLDEAAGVADAYAAMQRQLVAKLIELWPTAAWLAAGVRSAKQWLLAYTPLGYQEALRLEQVAELCAAHPALADAVVSGVMPMKRAVTIARFVTPERHRFFAELLPHLLTLNERTSDDEAFAEASRFWAGQVDQELAPRAEHAHTLALTPSLFGGGDINGHLSPSAFATVCAAIDGHIQDPDPKDAPYRRSFRERQADALDDICAAALTGGLDDDFDDDEEFEELRATDTFDGTSPTDDLDEQLAAAEAGEALTDLELLRRRLQRMEEQRRRRLRRRIRTRSGATVNAVVDVRTLLGLRDRNDLEDLILRGDGWHLTRGLLDRLVCDSGLLATIFAGPNQVLDANPRREQFTKAQRRAIAARDRCCVFPGCRRRPKDCDAHHLHPRGKGGPSVTGNGALLCRFHHRLVHEHGWRLQIHDGHWTAVDRHGQTWTGRPAPPELATAA